MIQVNSTGQIIFTVKDDTSSAAVTSSGALALSTWYHVAGVYDGANVKLYLNGLLNTEAAYSSGWELGSQPLRWAMTPYTTAPAFGTTVNTNGVAVNITINKPASTASGDLLIAHFSHHANDLLEPGGYPAGWAVLAHETTDPSTGMEAWLFWKIAGGSEPANYTWIITGGTVVWSGAITRFTGVDNTTPFANPVYSTGDEAVTALTTGAHVANVNNSMTCSFFSQQGTTTYTADSGTEQYDFGTQYRHALYTQTQATPASLNVTGTHGTADDSAAHTVILNGSGNTFCAVSMDDWGFWTRALDEIEVGIHFASRNAGPGSWTAVTTDVRNVSVPGASRQYELDRVEAGTSRVQLRDMDMNYDPGNTGSIYSPNVIPMLKIRGRGTWNAVTYELFEHYVERWPVQGLQALAQYVDITAVDGFDLLALARVEGNLEAGFSGAQINEVLSRGLWPVADRAIDTGQYVMAPLTISAGTSALGLIQELADSEGGIFFIDAAGIATYHDAAHRGTDARSTTSQATFSDYPSGSAIIYQELEPSFDKDRIINDWTVTPDSAIFGSASQRLADFTSIFQYGLRSQSKSTHLASNADALAQAARLLNETAQPTHRFDSMTVIPTTTAGYTECLDMRISDRVTVLRGSHPRWDGDLETKDCFVEGKAVNIPSKATPWSFTFKLSPVSSGNYYDTIVRGEPVSYWRMNTIT